MMLIIMFGCGRCVWWLSKLMFVIVLLWEVVGWYVDYILWEEFLMVMVLLQVVFYGDFLVQFIFVDDEDDMVMVVVKIVYYVVNLCVVECNLLMVVWFNDKQLLVLMKFLESGIGLMDYVEVGYVE